MNKRVWIALLLLALALCLSVSSYLLLQNCVGKLGQTLENAVYTDLPADESVRRIKACAAEMLPKLRIFAQHGSLDALTDSLNRLPLEQDDPALYRKRCLLCLRLLEEYAEGQKLTWDNVL